MDTYSLLREIADSWGLLAMFIFFLGAALWAFWPSQSEARREASMIPFKDWENEDSTHSDTGTKDSGKKRAEKTEGRKNG